MYNTIYNRIILYNKNKIKTNRNGKWQIIRSNRRNRKIKYRKQKQPTKKVKELKELTQKLKAEEREKVSPEFIRYKEETDRLEAEGTEQQDKKLKTEEKRIKTKK